MLLIDSLHINDSGGKILLDYLVLELEKQKVNVFYLFDKRVENDYRNVPKERKLYLKANIRNRYNFYKDNKNRFSKIFCFGNIPPITKPDCDVITYFHQPLYLKKIDKSNSLYKKTRLFLRKSILRMLKNNTDYWFIQLPSIKNELAKQYNISKDIIKIKPFYPVIDSDGKTYRREQATFLYVSSGAIHKNHKKLIEAFCNFYDKNKRGRLTVTVPDHFSEVASLISKKKSEGYPITNLGFIDREKLYEYYKTNEFLVFPSLAESFGLGIIEAIENGCNVIGADLDYMNDVCKPSMTFDPRKVSEIENALQLALDGKLKESKAKITNQINDIIHYLK